MSKATAYELHDSSAPLAREERILEAVLEDIQSDGDVTHEALATEATLENINEMKIALKMLLRDAIVSKGTVRQRHADEKLGKYIRARVFDYVSERVEA